MHFTRTLFVVAAVPLFSSIVAANKPPGNLAICLSDSSGGTGPGGGKACLGSVFDGIPKPSFRPHPTDSIGKVGNEETSKRPVPNWRYDNGLLRAIAGNGGDNDNDNDNEDEDPASEDLCLAPASPITTETTMPVDLVLRKCPENDDGGDDEDKVSGASPTTIAYARSVKLAKTQEMRFLVTTEGRIVSLAPITDPSTGGDVTGSRFFCLATVAKETNGDKGGYENARLAPCPGDAPKSVEEGGDYHHHQVFDVYGTYSESFLMPLRQTWRYDESVLIAYQLGLPFPEMTATNHWLASGGTDANAADDDDAFVEISMPWPAQINSVKILEPLVVETFPLSSTGGGILAFVPREHKIDGRMTTALKKQQQQQQSSSGGEGLVGNEVSFLVLKANVSIGRGPNGQYVIFAILLGCVVACFGLSLLAERICGSRTRSMEDENNDGKTVCISVDEEEEEKGFALEDDDPEEAATYTSGQEENGEENQNS